MPSTNGSKRRRLRLHTNIPQSNRHLQRLLFTTNMSKRPRQSHENNMSKQLRRITSLHRNRTTTSQPRRNNTNRLCNNIHLYQPSITTSLRRQSRRSSPIYQPFRPRQSMRRRLPNTSNERPTNRSPRNSPMPSLPRTIRSKRYRSQQWVDGSRFSFVVTSEQMTIPAQSPIYQLFYWGWSH